MKKEKKKLIDRYIDYLSSECHLSALSFVILFIIKRIEETGLTKLFAGMDNLITFILGILFCYFLTYVVSLIVYNYGEEKLYIKGFIVALIFCAILLLGL